MWKLRLGNKSGVHVLLCLKLFGKFLTSVVLSHPPHLFNEGKVGHLTE